MPPGIEHLSLAQLAILGLTVGTPISIAIGAFLFRHGREIRKQVTPRGGSGGETLASEVGEIRGEVKIVRDLHQSFAEELGDHGERLAVIETDMAKVRKRIEHHKRAISDLRGKLGMRPRLSDAIEAKESELEDDDL